AARCRRAAAAGPQRGALGQRAVAHVPLVVAVLPVCAAVGGPVSAATLTRTLRGWTAPASRWAARRRSGPPSTRQRARTDAAPCLPSLPPRELRRKAPAPLRSARA